MNDTWTDQPYAPGVVLIGDAAGWSDPIIGQGLPIAMRDVGIITDILRIESDWSKAFADYGEERRERMRRLRIAAQVRTDLAATFSSAGAADVGPTTPSGQPISCSADPTSQCCWARTTRPPSPSPSPPSNGSLALV